MLQRHVSLWDTASKHDDIDLDYVLLLASLKRRTATLGYNLAELNEAVLKLQSNHCSSGQAKAYTDSVLNVYPILGTYFNQENCIIHIPILASAVAIMQVGREQELNIS